MDQPSAWQRLQAVRAPHGRADSVTAAGPAGDGRAAEPDQAFDELLPTVYEELRALAGAILERSRVIDPTRTTSLINDVYVRLADRGLKFRDRGHFLALAARAMRYVLVDRARQRVAQKRGSGATLATLTDDIAVAPHSPDLVALDEALRRLAEFDPRKSQVIELRFFGALSVEEAGEVLGLSPATIKREWALARAWLFRELSGAAADR